jgi:hypothetical protein
MKSILNTLAGPVFALPPLNEHTPCELHSFCP